MSYYSILPSQRVGNAAGTVGFSGQNPDPMRPLQRPGGGFRTRDLNPDELAANQVAQITAAGGPLMQRAAGLGLARANQRGLTNSSLSSQAAQAAVLDAATPLALQGAAANTNVLDANMGAENTYLLEEGGWNTSRDIAAMNAAVAEGNTLADRENAALAREENRRQFDLEMAANERAREESMRRYDVDYQREQEQAAANDLRNRNNFLGSSIANTIFGNESLWRDPAGSMGFANYYTQNFGDLWDRLFGGGAPAAP